MIVACRVDDVLLISSDMDTMPGLLAHLRSHVEEGEEFLTDIVYLGVTRVARKIYLSQPRYVEEILSTLLSQTKKFRSSR